MVMIYEHDYIIYVASYASIIVGTIDMKTHQAYVRIVTE